jgi:23S rRNA (guanine2445-N2)-methyltransferase / 23S rRNA (guanine2069-N7)-methyltransferase
MSQLSSYNFFSTCPKGVEDLLVREAEQLGLENITQSHGGISFEGNLEGAYRLCLWSRIASRVLLQLSTFVINDYDELYEALKEVDWSSHLSKDGSFAVDCFTSHDTLTNSHYATLKIKDAIVDQFKEGTGSRPDIDRATPDIRVNVYISQSNSILYLDLSGEPLNKRGYRKQAGTAPLRENLAAAILMRCKWPEMAKQGVPFCDPMCGSGTLLIEAALMAGNIAPGVFRSYYGFINWKQHEAELWEKVFSEAMASKNDPGDMPVIAGADISRSVLDIAESNIKAANLSDSITLHNSDVSNVIEELHDSKGLLVLNPPYGKRLGRLEDVKETYTKLGQIFKENYQGWVAAVFTSETELAQYIGLRSHHKNTLYNGAIKCTLYQYEIRESQGEHKTVSSNEIHENADMFRNRLKKNLKHIRKWAKKNGISCYRIYDADIPQYSMAIDLYEDWIHVQEYEAPRTINTAKATYRLKDAIAHIADVLNVSSDSIIVKRRKIQSGSNQYDRHEEEKQSIVITEGGLKFSINLFDYLDTGIFLDHRNVRRLVSKYSAGKSFLNLFSYTGVATVYAVSGGACSTTSVDMSNTYLAWAQRNLRLNEFKDTSHRYIRADCMQWLHDAKADAEKYQLILLDPPTFSNSKKMSRTLDIHRDHVELIELAMNLLDDSGIMIFSCNARRFVLDEELLKDYSIQDITGLTTPEDFKRKPLHKCWCISKHQHEKKISLDP